jgi:HPt (histidine-containing phosphotransfer) domain-containing protein
MMSDKPDLDDTALARLRRVGGEQLVRQMVALFLESTPQRLVVARTGEQQGDREAVTRAMHALKSSAGNVGALRLQDLASHLEHTGKDLTREAILGLLEEIEATFARIKSHLEVGLSK